MSARAAADADHDVPDTVGVRVCTVVAPCLISTLTVVESPAALPAVPEMVGELLLMELPLTGDVTATPVGAKVSTVKALALLVVEFAATSVCVAVTV